MPKIMTSSNTATRAAPSRSVSRLLRLGLWTSIVVFAFFMQVLPFLLVMTMFNLAIGVKSGTTLVVIPVVAFGMFFFACWLATRYTRRRSGEAEAMDLAKRQIYIAPYPTRDGPMRTSNAHVGMLPHLQRFRSRLY